MRLRSSLLFGKSAPPIGFDFVSYQRNLLRNLGVPGFTLLEDGSSSEDDSVPSPSLHGRDDDSSVDSADPGLFLDEIQDQSFGVDRQDAPPPIPDDWN